MVNKPIGLIRQDRVIPKSADVVNEVPDKVEINDVQQNEIEKKSNKKSQLINQQKNIKVSNKTKEEIDVLLNLTNHKYAYELIETLIDNYVENALDNDQRRAYRTYIKIKNK